MKERIVPVKNITRLAESIDVLINRAPGLPGMGLIHGETGYGKTTAVTWQIIQVHGVYLRAMATWTPAAMLAALLFELDRAPRGGCNQMMIDLIEVLRRSKRPIFIDEADYLIDSKRMTEALRDLHDMTKVPVILIGMGGIDQRLSHRKQLTGRLLQDVRFEPADEHDVRLLANSLCEVTVRDDLLARVAARSGGGIRQVVVALARIEQLAKACGLREIGSAEWGKSEAFFTGEAPQVMAAGRVTALTTAGDAARQSAGAR